MKPGLVAAAIVGLAFMLPVPVAVAAPSVSSETVIAQSRTETRKPVRQKRRAVRSCPKWCENDTNPCDPPSYKYADGRCSYWDNY